AGEPAVQRAGGCDAGGLRGLSGVLEGVQAADGLLAERLPQAVGRMRSRLLTLGALLAVGAVGWGVLVRSQAARASMAGAGPGGGSWWGGRLRWGRWRAMVRSSG